MAAFAAVRVPELIHPRTADAVQAPAGGFLILLRLPLFRNLILVAALILGSHAMHDAFAVIRWSAAGISPAYGELALVRVGRRRGARVLCHWPGARDAADSGRRGRHRGTGWHAALGRDGGDN